MNTNINLQLDEILAEARAIKFAMKNGALSYSQAKERVKPLLAKVNEAGKMVAKKYRRKYRKIKFTDL
jgi:hypothetical protein